MPARKTTTKTTSSRKSSPRPKAIAAAATSTRLSSIKEVKQPRRLTTANASAVMAAVSHEDIQRKAYELWQRRGGDHLTNWIEAEAVLKRERALAASN